MMSLVMISQCKYNPGQPNLTPIFHNIKDHDATALLNLLTWTIARLRIEDMYMCDSLLHLSWKYGSNFIMVQGRSISNFLEDTLFCICFDSIIFSFENYCSLINKEFIQKSISLDWIHFYTPKFKSLPVNTRKIIVLIKVPTRIIQFLKKFCYRH